MYPNTPTPNPVGGYSYQGPTVVYKPPKGRSALKIIFAIFAAMVAALLALVVLLLIGAETGLIPLIIAMIVGTLPVPLYIMLVLWIDRYESEPFWMLAMAFIWGASVGVFASYLFNTASAIAMYLSTGSEVAAQVLSAIFAAPLFEESSKGLILFILFFWKKDEYDGVVDGFVYASMVGLGFAMMENFLYYGRVIRMGGLFSDEFNQIFFLRGVLSPFSHPLFTSMTGISLGLARKVRNGFLQFLIGLGGLVLAMCLHGLWNFSAVLSGALAASWHISLLKAFFMIYAVVMIPIFLVTIGIVLFALRSEGKMVREFLLPYLQHGLFTQEEYNRLTSVRGRMGASLRAFRSGGFGIWRARMQYNQMASELAFHRHRLTRGVVTMNQEVAEREQAMVQLLLELRQRLGQH